MKRQALLQGRQKKDSYDMGGDLVGGSLEGGLDSIGQRGVTGISRLPKTFASLDLRTGDFDYVRNLSFGFWFRFWVLSFVIEKLVQVFFVVISVQTAGKQTCILAKGKNQILKLNQFISQSVDNCLTLQTHSAWILAMDKLAMTFKTPPTG